MADSAGQRLILKSVDRERDRRPEDDRDIYAFVIHVDQALPGIAHARGPPAPWASTAPVLPPAPDSGRRRRRRAEHACPISSIEVTGGEPIRSDRSPFRLLATALRQDSRTARVEAAAGGRAHRVGHLTSQDDPL